MIVNSQSELKLVCSDVDNDMNVLETINVVAYLDKILVCNVYFDLHLDRLKSVLLVLGNDILIFDLNKYLSCTYDPGLLVFVLSIQERQIQPLNESIDRAQQPEFWRSIIVQTGYLGDASDRGSVHEGYLDFQKVFCLDSNFPGKPIPQGFTEAWNHLKIFTEEGVMNFSNRRFPSPSICEYPAFEADSSLVKKRPEPKPIIGFNMSLSSFQKAQYQEKWPRNHEVMIHSPKPVKPVLHLPQLEANRFNQLQTRHWRPGDHSNQSGGIPGVLSYTRTQEISRFNGESLKSNRSYLWKDWTIFRFDHFLAIPIRPEDIRTKPRRPGDFIGVQEEFHEFLPCTRPHWIRRIHTYTKLPYLEILAIKLQQLFSLQIRHEIRTYPAPRKVPRKLSYPLKPSRFKKNQVSHLEPKSHKRLQRLVSDFVTLLDLFPFLFVLER